MKEFKEKLIKGNKGSGRKLAMLITILVVLCACMLPVYATPTPTPAPTLQINFDIQQMFTWAQTIINAMLPVVYIIMGVALGFLIIRAFKAAFN